MARRKKKKKTLLSFPPKTITLQFTLSFSFNVLLKKKPWTFISFSYAVRPEEIKYLSLKGCMGCENKLQ